MTDWIAFIVENLIWIGVISLCVVLVGSYVYTLIYEKPTKETHMVFWAVILLPIILGLLLLWTLTKQQPKLDTPWR